MWNLCIFLGLGNVLLVKWLKGYAQRRLVWMISMCVELDEEGVDEWVFVNMQDRTYLMVTFAGVNS